MNNNYARSRRTDEIVFFNDFVGELPELLHMNPNNWVLWRRRHLGHNQFRVVGETSDEFCILNNHEPKLCKACKTPGHVERYGRL